MNALRSLRGARALAVAGTGLLALALVPTSATAADGEHDAVSDARLAVACMTGDQIDVYLRFHVDAAADAPEEARVMAGQASAALHGDPDDYFEFPLEPEGLFPITESGDYEVDVSDDALRSILEDDHLTATLLYGDGEVAATVSTVVECYDVETEISDIDVTVRATVPTTIRLREHVTLGGSGETASGDTPRQAWVVSPGLVWDADGRGDDTLDDLVLEPAVQSALGASLANQVLTLRATTAGVYDLEWGLVTTPIEDEGWTGGYGDRHGPAALRIRVIDRPVHPDESALTAATKGAIDAPPAATAGATTTLTLPGQGGEYVDVWLHSDPVHLGLVQVPASGVLSITVPASAAVGDHRVIVTDPVGGLIGWDEMRVTQAAAGGGGNRVPRGATGLDEGAGSPLPAAFVALLAAAAAAGAAAYGRERRRQH